MRVDNLQMDMSGVELLVANAHLQVQRVEDEVIKEMKDHMEDYERKSFIWEGGVTERLNFLELGKERTDAKCDNVQEVLASWMVTFGALETSIGRTAEDVKVIEDWLEPNSWTIIEAQEQITGLADLVKDQASTIRLLQQWVGELELGHGVLRAHVINIEVGR
jgi:type I site-specific restriction endonuclease